MGYGCPQNKLLYKRIKETCYTASGHYVFASEEFQQIKSKFPGVDDKIKRDYVKEFRDFVRDKIIAFDLDDVLYIEQMRKEN